MKTAYIGIGSNIGDRVSNCLKAVEEIKEIHGCRFISQSELFLTKPVGVEDQDWYVNAVISVAAGVPPSDLLGKLLAIETRMGRIRRRRWEARIIDLDLLLFGQEFIAESDLTVPHPRLHLRRFVLEPLVRLAPDLVHPTLGKTVSDLLRDFEDDGQAVVPLKDS
jgi:2-amino-4-hydroxy-6-hydroxymethyldihydropteridine diphosphokinase